MPKHNEKMSKIKIKPGGRDESAQLIGLTQLGGFFLNKLLKFSTRLIVFPYSQKDIQSCCDTEYA